MAEFATIARPYAKALFELANEKHQIESWLSGLRELAWSVAQARVASLIEDTRTNSKEKADFLLKLLTDEQVAGDKTFRNFVHVVADEKRLLVLPEIYVQYQDLVLSRNNTKKAVIYSAFEFASEGQKAKIVADLEQHFNTRLEAVFNVEPSLIAGIKVEVDDQVLDLSIQGKLQKLYTAMTN
ncbi:F0F1 ATP synthase subunit delta [Neisseria elongata]|uniref:ATP synthase subunit delta n=1 Tax=Neisseria elongata subsp. nitroreducens TaxID=90367 RepID=A0A9X0ZQX8_NEIEL|nr:F0F1 ATP synthase subunit delta [Neisseria elongata]MBS9339591.1 F0F1 ATP synthase subunit delta [Neisseria elongata subsp. nitroreducens]MBS9340364.1 F0F1 ATP synthase subunit delta [Neisseria elongata subsp. nitroreducens]